MRPATRAIAIGLDAYWQAKPRGLRTKHLCRAPRSYG
jgi:hypothetical protein